LNIAVLSGKGGTGKTTVSVNLALALNANYIDADVEEPNGFLFLEPQIYKVKDVLVEYPIIDKDKCTLCGECVRVCQFNALAKAKEEIVLFQKLCHSCGACQISCKFGAIEYSNREIGKIEKGKYKNIGCSRGILNVGEPMAVPVIKELLRDLTCKVNVIDCPPGTSCNVINVLRYADVAVLVTEPSEFGLHDLKMAVELVKTFKIPFGIVINKDDGGENIIKVYCKKEGIKIIGLIPYEREIAFMYSKGKILYEDVKYKELFDELASRLKEELKWN